MFTESTISKELATLAQTDAFETDKLELWFQPVYQTKTGAVLHNEVLLRWRDEHGNVQLPQEFLPSLSSASSLQQLDQLVIRKATELLAQQPDRCFSVNLSGEGLDNLAVIEYIQTVLEQSGVKPEQLSFELTELAIAKNFTDARTFIRELKNLGCSIVLDDFASRHLTLFQCQQLDIDLVKVDGQLIQRLKTDPSSRVLTRAILEGVQALTKVAAKFVSDEVTQSLVDEVGIDCVQGYHFKPPSPAPVWSELVKSPEDIALPAPEANKPPLAWRLLIGMGFTVLALAAVAVGLNSIRYRLTHLTVNGAVINGRIVRLQAPVEGSLEAFYARPGLEVTSGQVLARIETNSQPKDPKDEQDRLRLVHSEQSEQIRRQLENTQLQGEIQVKATQLAAERQTLVGLKNQLQSLERQNQAVQQVNVQLASESVSEEQAAVDAAIAKAEAARSEYQRYKMLVTQGAVSKQRTEEVYSDWQSAEAEVRQAKAALRSTRASLKASKNGIPLNNQNDLSNQRPRLEQAIQSQEALVKTLEAQVASTQQRLNQAEVLYKNRPSVVSLVSDRKPVESDRQIQAVSAPFSGIIYRTDREQGERVSQSEPLMTLLDCNDLWVETVVSAGDAERIDSQQPVSVRFSGSSEPLTGEVELIQPISRLDGSSDQAKLRQTQALMPTIPPKLHGQPLALVTVRIPPPPQYTKSQQFCGVGQATELTFGKTSKQRG